MPAFSDPTGTRLVGVNREQCRCVWLTEEEAHAIYLLLGNHASPGQATGWWERYKAAPANPAEAVREALPYHPLNQRSDPDLVTRAVLAALGCVVERPANTGDHHA